MKTYSAYSKIIKASMAKSNQTEIAIFEDETRFVEALELSLGQLVAVTIEDGALVTYWYNVKTGREVSLSENTERWHNIGGEVVKYLRAQGFID